MPFKAGAVPRVDADGHLPDDLLLVLADDLTDLGLGGGDGAGTPGPSAYDVAVENGFVGTEAEWLASLKGDTGDVGPAGPAGTNGTNGTNAVWTQVTQAEYDAGPKTAGVLYVVVG